MFIISLDFCPVLLPQTLMYDTVELRLISSHLLNEQTEEIILETS